MVILFAFLVIMSVIAVGLSVFAFLKVYKFPIDPIGLDTSRAHLNNVDILDIATTEKLESANGEVYIDTMVLPGLKGEIGSFTQDKHVSGFQTISAETAVFDTLQTDSFEIKSNSAVLSSNITTTLSRLSANEKYVIMKTNQITTTNKSLSIIDNSTPTSFIMGKNPSESTGIVSNVAMDAIITANVYVSSTMATSKVKVSLAINHNVIETRTFKFDSPFNSNLYFTSFQNLARGDSIKVYVQLTEDGQNLTLKHFSVTLRHA